MQVQESSADAKTPHNLAGWETSPISDFYIVIDRTLLKFPLAHAPQINGDTLLIAELGTEMIALALCCGFYCAIMVADCVIELYEICFPYTYILCSFALSVYFFLLLIRIFKQNVAVGLDPAAAIYPTHPG